MLKQRVSLFWAYLSVHRRRAGFLGLLVLLNVTLTVLNPQWLGRFIDRAGEGGSTDSLVRIALVFIALTILNQVVVTIAGYVAEDLSWRATNKLRTDLVDHCLDLDMSFHKEHTPGELIERIDGDVATMGGFFSTFVFHMFANSVLAVGIVGVTFFVDWRTGLTLLAFALVVVPLVRKAQRRVKPYFTAMRQTNAELSGVLEESVSATEDVRGNGAERYVLARLDGHLDRFRRLMKIEAVATRASSSILEVSVALATGGIFALGAYLISHGDMALGQLYVSYFYMSMLSMALFRIAYRIDGLQVALASMDRTTEILDTESRVADSGRTAFPATPPTIEIDGVTFSYAPGTPTLNDISFEVPAGQSLALLGRTGSGKTTVGRLLHRAMDATGGSIRFAGTDIRDIPLDELHRQVGVVTQDVHIFRASVRDNLTMFDPDITDDQVWAALDGLAVKEWISGLPDQLDTVLQDGNGAISAGQAQLLALTRLFLRDPAVIVLDEPSSRLDPATERLIHRSLTELMEGRTAVVIAHHLSTIKNLDRVVILEDGEVLESGERETLAADPSSRLSSLLTGSYA
ncbi:ABC transporter ATP-binding protein [Streptomyces tendae]|uniref:ABC transporter ATP-binding protein n=1 Tax=Streptomyces tendae TaxID=1932 RepID=UPI0024922949|nr:ABC transporter ATP-binding protein [Streptomyces tendae]